MFAVIKTGGKQYRVAAEDTITVAKLTGEPGQSVTFDQVLMLSNDNGVEVGAPLVSGVTVTGATQVGAPVVSGVSVAGEIVSQTRGPKVIAFKKRRRQNSRRKRGHRQDYTVVRIAEILAGGEKPKAASKAKSTQAAAPEAAPADAAS